ncbi:MAG: YcaO-like family protein [Geminicoccaceae bacterium]
MAGEDVAASKQWLQGTHRLVPPAVTLERVRPLMPAMGITRLADLTGLDRIGLPVVASIRPNSRSVSVSMGKGHDLDAAKASALMEAAESWHAERTLLPLRWAAADELDGAVADLEAMPRHGRVDPTRRSLWVAGRCLRTDEAVWLPYEAVHTDYTLPQPAGSGVFLAESNGLASGNDAREATCHALCELIERDAVAAWGELPIHQRHAMRVDLSTVEDEINLASLDRLRSAGMAVHVWDITSDVGVATYVCLIVDRREPQGHSGLGSGCHLQREIALSRAVLEAVQVRATYITGARDDLQRQEYEHVRLKGRLATARKLVGEGRPVRRVADAPTVVNASLDDDIEWLLLRLAAAGVPQAIAVDLSRADWPLAVVRVVAPGLAPEDEGTPVLQRRRAA